MAYNKAKAEREWQLWKDAEEKQMRRLGVDEETIAKIREYDWAVFNSNRRFYQRIISGDTYLEDEVEGGLLPEIKTVEQFLDSLEDEELHRLLATVDKLTLQIVLLHLQGYTASIIASYLGITQKSVYRRMDHLKEKIKKFL